jgi:hypothetical protein
MSEELKQAAEELADELGFEKDSKGYQTIYDTIDAATTKLQDQLSEFAGIAIKNGQEVVRLEGEAADLRELRDLDAQQIAKLREILEHCRLALLGMYPAPAALEEINSVL